VSGWLAAGDVYADLVGQLEAGGEMDEEGMAELMSEAALTYDGTLDDSDDGSLDLGEGLSD